MEKLKAKLKKQGGFTMVELLIVVAIIAILVAVSIPMMKNALERSRHAVDQANVRDAIALASVEYVTNPNDADFAATAGKTYTYCVDDKSQGYLMETPGANDTSAKPQCNCGIDKTLGLEVTVKAPDDPNVDGARPEITTTWYFDTTAEETKTPGP